MKFSVLSRGQPGVILDALSTALITVNQALRITYVNSAGEALFSLSRHHALGEPVAQAIPHFAEHEERLRRALETGGSFVERELKLRRPGEDPITVDCVVTPTTGGRPGLLVELMPLDRHLRISRDELMHAQHRASRELIRGLAHEIKNPLGGIRGAAQLLEREFPDSEHLEYTRVIIREVDRLQSLVDRMLGPNRLPRKAPVNVHQILEHVRQLLEAESGSGIAFLRDYDPSIPELVADSEQLIQSILNVGRNALQALGVNGTGVIVLRSRTRRQHTIGGQRHKLVVQVDIEDNGPGIPPSMLEHVFLPMVTTRADGTGLGLPIAQYLITSHGGLIECQSQVGRTVFSIFLPLEPTT
jgi:two-component system nitrogen regulation sensor histidine kinase GlnL